MARMLLRYRWDRYVPGQGVVQGQILFPSTAAAYRWLLQQPPEIRADPHLDLVAVAVPEWDPEREPGPEVQAP